MSESEEQLKTMMEQAEQRERKARRNALLYTLVPVALAIGLLVVTGWQVQKASQAVAAADLRLGEKQAALVVVQATLTDTQKNLNAVSLTLTDTQKTLVAANAQVTLASTQAQAAMNDLVHARETLTTTTKELDDKSAQLNKLQTQVDELSKQLKMAKHFEDQYFPDSLDGLYKHTETLSYYNQVREGVFELFEKIYGNQKVDWKINGTSFSEGVNSPTFVAMILGLMSQPALSIDQETLMQFLPLQKKEPQIGDVVYYSDGLTFFYFENEQGQRAVVGMTPFGVAALNYDFAKPLGIGDTSKVLNR